MQDIDCSASNSWQAIRLTKLALIVLACPLFWFIPITHGLCYAVDMATFKVLNGSLEYAKIWAYFWGYLNHSNEAWFNLLVMLGLNGLGIYSLPANKRISALAGSLYFWLFFQLVIILTHWVFTDILHSARLSPSYVISPFINLGQVLHKQEIKVFGNRCFPAGHALVLIFWGKFSMRYSAPWVHKFIWATAILLLLPRLFSGAHWLSDIVFTSCLSLLWFEFAAGTPLFFYVTNILEKTLNFIWLRTSHAVGTI